MIEKKESAETKEFDIDTDMKMLEAIKKVVNEKLYQVNHEKK